LAVLGKPQRSVPDAYVISLRDYDALSACHEEAGRESLTPVVIMVIIMASFH